MTTHGDLLDILQNMSEKQRKSFTWKLKYQVPEGFSPIKKAELEKADSEDTVEKMVETYQLDGAVKITVEILILLERNDLAEQLRKKCQPGPVPKTVPGPAPPGGNSTEDGPVPKTVPGPAPPGGNSTENVKLLSAGLEKLSMERGKDVSIKFGPRKHACDLTMDTNTAHRQLSLSEENRKVTLGKEDQPYPDHPERFDKWRQVLCREGLSGRCYWEVERNEGQVFIGVTYKGISRKGFNVNCLLGRNEKSWSLFCDDDSYSAWHNKKESVVPVSYSSSSSSSSLRVGVYLNWPAGSLAFYGVSSGTLTHLFTFHTTFTEPVYPGFGLGEDSSVSLCQIE